MEVLDTLSDGRLLDEIYAYETGWGLPSARDRHEIVAIMSAVEEEETQTEGTTRDLRGRPAAPGRRGRVTSERARGPTPGVVVSG